MSTAEPDPTAGLRIREAARAILLTPDAEVLLVRFEFPDGTRWALPGGGIEPGESVQDALRRELAEEVGLVDAPIGPHVWTRLHVIPFIGGDWDGQREDIHLVPVERFDPQPHMTWDELHEELVFELRWWPLAEIEDGLPFVPRALRSLLEQLVADGPPNQPVDAGI